MRKGLILWFIILLTPLLFLSCPSSTEPIIYERIVIDIYPPVGGPGEPDTDVALYDEGGVTELAKDETNPPGSIDTEAEGLSLSSGTYVIKVYNEEPLSIGGESYVVRAISLALLEAIPGTDEPTAIPNFDGTDYFEGAGDTPTSTTAVLELDVNWVQRSLANGADVDYLKLVLP